MTENPDVDALAAHVRAQPGGPATVALWRAVLGLEHWWLLPTGTPEDPRPMVGVVGDHRYLLAFTGHHHVATFAAARGGPDPATGTPAMAVTPADLTGLTETLAGGGIAGVLFDQGVHDLVAPLAGLRSMWTRFGAAV